MPKRNGRLPRRDTCSSLWLELWLIYIHKYIHAYIYFVVGVGPRYPVPGKGKERKAAVNRPQGRATGRTHRTPGLRMCVGWGMAAMRGVCV